jgi:Trp operon repressor
MQVSKQKVNKILDIEIAKIYYQLIADVKTPKEAEEIFKCLLSETETVAVMKRLAIGYWLIKKRSYGVISQNLKVSSATVATVAQELKKPGWQLAIKKVLADEWATKWEERINKILKR